MSESIVTFDEAGADELRRVFEKLVARAMDVCSVDGDTDGDVTLYATGLAQLSEVLRRAHTQGAAADPAALSPEEISELGSFGHGLIEGLRECVAEAGAADLEQELEQLQIPLALWIIRHRGGWSQWESLTNALAEQANRLRDPIRLRRLSEIMGELIEAAPPWLRGDLERLDPSRPWRVLHLNRAIVATRSFDVAAMEVAFDALLARLPEDAGPFFDEGVRRSAEMDAPAEVLGCFERYQARAPRQKAH